jgi:hypothetical protein
LLRRATRQNQSDGLLVHGFDKTAAIKAAFGGATAASVRYPKESHCANHQIGGLVLYLVARLGDAIEQTLVDQKFTHFVVGWASLGGTDATGKNQYQGEAGGEMHVATLAGVWGHVKQNLHEV